MRLTSTAASALSSNVPLVALLVDDSKPRSLPGGGLGERAATLIARKVFSGKPRETLLLHADGGKGPRALLLVGVGKRAGVGADDLRRAGAVVCTQAATLGANKVLVGSGGKLELDRAALGAVAEGLSMAGYRYPRREAKTTPPAEACFATSLRGAATVLRTARAVAEGNKLARELGDLPGNICTPRYLRDAARKLSTKGGLKFRAYDKKALTKLKYGGILAVNQGSVEQPFLLEMDYKPARHKKTICVVGKGLTFDTGGISLKPAAKMEEMKYDMCGAAAVIGFMQTVAALKPKGVRIVGLVGTTDNMPSGSAYKPGDVVTTGSGHTIDVINTDAEGRVVLSDCIHHAAKLKPDHIVDLATLTGAILVALGSEAAGLFTKDDKLAARLEEASARTGERLWRLPVYEAYEDAIKSKWADVKNSGGRDAGSATAAAFLFTFNNGVSHAHLDIAGTAWDGPKREYNSPGHATGFGVRLLWDFVSNA